MKRSVYFFGALATCLILCSCSSPWITNTARSAIEQHLISATIERGVACADFGEYAGKKAFMDYSKFEPQVDKAYAQGVLETQLSRAKIIITDKLEGADIIVQPLCGVLGTDHSKFLIGTPPLPVPVPDADLSIIIPEISFFSKISRYAYGRFTFNVFNASDRKPLATFEGINSSAVYNDWVVVLIPFTTHNININDTQKSETTFSMF